jgi:hypothetical protein
MRSTDTILDKDGKVVSKGYQPASVKRIAATVGLTF